MSTQEYPPIPADALRVYVDAHSCGDDYCNCNYIQVRCEVPATSPAAPSWRTQDTRSWHVLLWEGTWFWPDNRDFQEKELPSIREETQKACDHYGIQCDLSSGSVWDWTGERILQGAATR